MTKMQLACYSLIASSFILAGLLLVSLQDRMPAAQGSLVVTKDTFTFLTTQARAGDEALFVLDNVNEKLLIYTTTLAGVRGRTEPVKLVDLTKMFEPAGGANPKPPR
jgi:hypothetical protein